MGTKPLADAELLARVPSEEPDSGPRAMAVTSEAGGAGAMAPTVDGRAAAGTPMRGGLAPGLRIEQYELIRLLGQGGMGEVHLARDTRLGRKVAIKFLRPGSPGALQRFIGEAQATAQCTHENIVVIHEVGEYAGRLYMVLEYLEGQTLHALLGEGPLPPLRAVELILPVVRALGRAHAFGLVHRDLKPENIHVLDGGGVKVLDFGIAKLFASEDEVAADADGPLTDGSARAVTQAGALVGTVPYMAPEQWTGQAVDPRTDLWQVGLILREMITGDNPLGEMSFAQAARFAVDPDRPVTPIGEELAGLPVGLETLIDTCVAKRPADRYQSAAEVLDALTALLPRHFGAKLGEDESPYPGLVPFQERDAARFFGRSRETDAMATRIRDLPMMAVVGPSGVGKSSFVRAGLVPRLKAAGEPWEVLIARPGRHPLAALAHAVAEARTTRDAGSSEARDALVERLRAAPGGLGEALRERAVEVGARLLLFVDQFEELFTLGADRAEQDAFVAALCGAADDAAAPVRVVLSLRSDFLDRAAEHERLIQEITRGLVFLQTPTGDALRDAVVQPAEMAGFRFEDPATVEDMLGGLEGTPGALPLLQFAASKLWEARQRKGRLLTRAAYEAMGGVAGLLAKHADDVLAQLDAPAQRLTHAIFLRLVTPERTRAVVDAGELEELAEDPEVVRRTLRFLVQSRLLVVQTRGEHEGATVELVHESLIARWPTLRRWLDEDTEHAAFLSQLGAAARQWEARGRPQGLLWRGEALEEARRFKARFRGELSRSEGRYLDAVLALARRTIRTRRVLITAVITVLAALTAWALINMFDARRETDRAHTAEQQVRDQIEELQAKERARLAAEAKAKTARTEADEGKVQLATTEEKLDKSYEDLEAALKEAQAAQKEAEAARKRAEASSAEATASARDAQRTSEANRKLAAAERAAKERAEKVLAEKNALVKRLKEQLQRIETDKLR